MLDDVLRYLACPYCGAGLTRAGSALRCARGHAFNVARQGYASLLPKEARGEGGDVWRRTPVTGLLARRTGRLTGRDG